MGFTKLCRSSGKAAAAMQQECIVAWDEEEAWASSS